MILRSLVLAGTAATLTALSPAAAQGPGSRTLVEQCMIGDGSGRYKPCDELYVRRHPNWRETDSCMTDDGQGRYRPCGSLLKKEDTETKR